MDDRTIIRLKNVPQKRRLINRIERYPKHHQQRECHARRFPMSNHSAAVSARAPRSGLLSRTLGLLSLGLAARRHRRALLKLEPHLLRDIGLTDADARAEASRPFWDVPSHWRG
jgi:uncharacterized protein YjiS (DUF1127 family)